MDHPIKYMLGLVATSSVLQGVSWLESFRGVLPILNTGLMVVGTTAVLLYQKKLDADREARREDIAAGLADSPLVVELRAQRDAAVADRARLLAEVLNLAREARNGDGDCLPSPDAAD